MSQLHNSTLKKRIIVLYNGIITELDKPINGPILSPFYCDLDKIRFMLTAKKRLYWVWDDGTQILLTLDNYTWDDSNGYPPIPPEPETAETFAQHITEELDSAKGLHGEIRYWQGKFQYYDDALHQWVDVLTDQAPYSNVEPTELGVGGILPGTHLGGKTLDAILNKMFFNTAPPVISIQTSPDSGVREIGEVVGSVLFTIDITKGQNPITSVKVYKDANLIYTGVVTDTPVLHYGFTYSTSFNTNCVFRVEVMDSDCTFNKEVSFKFVAPIYMGKLAKNLLINQINITTNLTEMLVDQDTPIKISNILTTDDERILFAYPSSLGNLQSIMDENDWNLLYGGFVKTIVPILIGNGNTINYNVYSSENSCTVESYKLTFDFNN